MNSLFEHIERCKNGDNKSLEILIEKFNPIIVSLSYKCKNEYCKSDIIIFLIKLIKNINLNKLNNTSDGVLVKYIEKSLKREFFKNNKKEIIVEVELNDSFESSHYGYIDVEFEILLNELKKKKIINNKQYNVLFSKYYLLNKEKEIAIELGISRQAVNKINKSAIKNIKSYLVNEMEDIKWKTR